MQHQQVLHIQLESPCDLLTLLLQVQIFKSPNFYHMPKPADLQIPKGQIPIYTSGLGPSNKLLLGR